MHSRFFIARLPLAVKAGFIRKVYGILSIQLLFTVASSAFFMFHEPTRLYVLANPNMLMAAAIAPFGFLLGLFCYRDRRAQLVSTLLQDPMPSHEASPGARAYTIPEARPSALWIPYLLFVLRAAQTR